MDFAKAILRAILFYTLVIIGVTLAFIWDADAADTTQIVRMIRVEAKHAGIDPDLAVAIAEKESRFNQAAIGSQGEIGIFQLKPQFHGYDVRNIQTNIKAGVQYLVEVRQICKPKYSDAWIICYNLGPHYAKPIRYPRLFPYYVEVMKLRTKQIASN